MGSTEMEVEENNIEIEENDEEENVPKKTRKFFAKEFRQNLKSNNGSSAMKEFVQLCTDEDAKQDCALEFIENGGNLSDIVQFINTLDQKNANQAVPSFQAYNIVLLRILSVKPDKLYICEESCRQFLVKYFPFIKTMLSLNSTSKQRKVALKLLSCMTTMSPTLAKDVLAYASFDFPILDVLTNATTGEDGNSVRTSFIHFLLSFLVEGNTAIITSFLEKRGLLTSIFNGLLFDKYETVELVLTTIQHKILEDKHLSKTIKMNTFNTQVVKNLVNLYNWKGPVNKKTGTFKKRMSQTGVVDPAEKNIVCECVHRFLLVLCTSKYGVIFRDPTIGLSGKVHNSLMLTVLQGLGKPWDHPLASELVSKICIVCPDLVKPVLIDVVPFLEPRVSVKWLNAIRFVKKLIGDLPPETLSQYFEKLSIRQVGIIIQTLCIPKNIIQIITSENLLHEHMGVSQEIIELLYVMCNTVSKYLSYVNNLSIFTDADKIKLKDTTVDYLEQNLPSLSLIISVWKKSTIPTDVLADPDVPPPHLSTHLSTLLDILYVYHIICPPLIDDISNEIDSLNFLETIEKICIDNKELSSEMYVKAINLFLMCDFASFLPTTDLFAYAIPLLLKIYSENKNTIRDNAELTLIKLIKNSGIFEGCEQEIKIWLYSVLENGIYNDKIGAFFTSALKLTNKNFLKYCKDITSKRDTVTEECSFNFKALIESLSVDVNKNSQFAYEKNTHIVLSPFILGVLNTLLKSDKDELESYLNISLVHLLHAQTSPKILTSLVSQEKYIDLLNKNLLKYFQKWNECDSLISLKKIYHNKNIVTKLSKILLSDEKDASEIKNFIDDTEIENYHLILLSRVVIFYLTQLAKTKLLTETIQNKCFEIAVYLLNKSQTCNNFSDCMDIILRHPILIQIFSPTRSEDDTENLCTKFILKIIEELIKGKSKIDLEPYLNSYRTILLRHLHIMLQKNKKNKKPPKNNKFMNVVNLLDLSAENCIELLKLCTSLPSECMVSAENLPSAVVELQCYILNQNLVLYSQDKTIKPFNDTVIKELGLHLFYLNNYSVEINLDNLEFAIYNYIQQYPHTMKCFNDNIFKSIILKPSINRNTARLAMMFLQCDIKLFDIVLESLDNIIDKRELVFSLLNAVLDVSLPSIDNFIEKIYAKHEQIILKVLIKPQKIAQYIIDYYKIIIKIINEYMSLTVCENFVLKNNKFDVTELFHFEILTALFDKCIKSSTEKNKFISSYITTAMNLIVNILKRSDKTDEDWRKVENVLKCFCMYLNKLINIYKIDYKDENLSKNASFQSFSKLSLKFGLMGHINLIETLKRICELCSNENEYLGMLFEMAVSHSESLNILLDNQSKVKPQLVNLLFVLCKKCPSVIIKNHIPVWLGAFEGTVSLSDQCLLQLLCLYEEANIGFQEYKPYLWGKAAISHYSVRFGMETALWRQPKPGEVLDIFDAEKIKHTITHFPRSRMLTPSQPFYSNEDTAVYDPAFYLPLLSQLLAPESTIRWYQCKFGAIALVIMALTSDVTEVRTAACHVLARFHGHLEAGRYGKDRLLWLHFIEAVCRAASTMENLQMSTIAGTFMARCAMVFNRPDDSLYNALANFIMAKECPDIKYVPEMLELLHSSDVKYVEHRNFILEVMRDGMKTDNDLKVIFRSMAVKLLMDMYNSVVMNHEGKRLVLEIISAVVSLPTGARVLTASHGLMSWLFAVIKQLGPNDSDLLSAIIDLIHKMISALDAEQFQKNQFNVLLCLVSIINTIQNIKINLADLVKFVSMLYIVYEKNPIMISKTNLIDLLNVSVKYVDCHICNYYIDFDRCFVQKPQIQSENLTDQGLYYLKLLTLKWIDINHLNY